MKLIRLNIPWFIFLFAFLFFNISGYWLQADAPFSNNSSLLILAVVFSLVGSLILISIANLVWHKFVKNKIKDRPYSQFRIYKRKKSCAIFLISCLILIFVWTLYLLAFYPGIFSYDVNTQLGYTQSVMNTHHPIAHTLLLDLFINKIGGVIGSATLGFLSYSVFQLILFALQVSYIILFLYRSNIKKLWIYILIAFFALFPPFGTMAISSTKDTLFAGCLPDYFVCIVALIYFIKVGKDSKKNLNVSKKSSFSSKLEIEYFVVAIISGIGTCILRNNGIFVVALSAILILIFVRPLSFKVIVPTIAVVVSSILILLTLKVSTSAQSGPKLEAMAVPAQQLAYTYKEHRYDSDFEDSNTLQALFPDISAYDPAIVDPIKTRAKSALNSTSILEIAKEYIRLGLRYPADYIVAFINNARGYLYVADTSSSSIYDHGAELGRGYIINECIDNSYGISQDSKLPFLKDFLSYWFNDNHYQENPILVFIFSISTWNWLFIAFTIAIFKKKMIFRSVYSLPLFWLLTLLAGPCCLLRYAFPIFVFTPVSGFLASRSKEISRV